MIFKIPTNFLLVLVAITSSIIANDNQLMMQNNTQLNDFTKEQHKTIKESF